MLEPDDLEAYDDEDEDDDVLTSTKPRKISERRRRMNVIADSYIQEMAQKSLKEDIRNNCQNLEDQSARYIVHQAESQKIISTPREYQTELFERAKEKNIIAVLDTGKQTSKLIEARLTFQALVKHSLLFSYCVTYLAKSLRIELLESQSEYLFSW